MAVAAVTQGMMGLYPKHAGIVGTKTQGMLGLLALVQLSWRTSYEKLSTTNVAKLGFMLGTSYIA